MRTFCWFPVVMVGAGVLVGASSPCSAGPFARQSPAPDRLVACWQWSGGQLVDVHADGTMTLGAVSGRWRATDAPARKYFLEWPEIEDAAVLSADGRTLTETNVWFTLTATRASAGSGIVGAWRWPNGVPLTIQEGGTFDAGGIIKGRWQRAGAGEGTYTLTWPGPKHSAIVAADGQSLSGADQYGNKFSATRSTQCERR